MPTFYPPRATTAIFVLSSVLLAACGRDERPDPHTMIPSAQVDMSDAAITSRVKARMAADRQLSAFDIRVETHGGRVLLRGAAPDTDARRHAAKVALTEAGVVEVKNDLSVQVAAR